MSRRGTGWRRATLARSTAGCRAVRGRSRTGVGRLIAGRAQMRSLSAPGLSTIALWPTQRRRFAQPKPSAEEPRQQSSGWDVARLAQRKAAESEAGAFTWQSGALPVADQDNQNAGVRSSPVVMLSTLSMSVGPGLEVAPLGFGTWAWGNKLLWGYDENADGTLREAFDHAQGSVGSSLFFDTGDSYGTGALEGRAESLLGEFRRESAQPDRCVIGTKLAVYPNRLTGASFEAACRASLERMGRDQLEVVQAHWSAQNFQPWQEPALWDGLARCHEAGLARAVGTSNFGPKQCVPALTHDRLFPSELRSLARGLATPQPDARTSSIRFRRLRKVNKYWSERGVPHSVNQVGAPTASGCLPLFAHSAVLWQVQLSLLSTLPIESGLLDECADLGITPIGYSPLGLGVLSGKSVPPFSTGPALVLHAASCRLLTRAPSPGTRSRTMCCQTDRAAFYLSSCCPHASRCLRRCARLRRSDR